MVLAVARWSIMLIQNQVYSLELKKEHSSKKWAKFLNMVYMLIVLVSISITWSIASYAIWFLSNRICSFLHALVSKQLWLLEWVIVLTIQQKNLNGLLKFWKLSLKRHQFKVFFLGRPLGLGVTSNITRMTNEGHRLAAAYEARWTQFFSLNIKQANLDKKNSPA